MPNDSASSINVAPLFDSTVDDGEVAIRDIYELVKAGKWTIVVVAAAVMLVASLYLLLATRTYQADGLVQVEQNSKDGATPPAVSDLSSLLGGSPVQTEAEIQILQSRLILDDVIDKMNLSIAALPRYFPFIGAAIARSNQDAPKPVAAPWGLGVYAWGGESIEVPKLEVPNRLIGKKLELRATPDGYLLRDPDGRQILSGVVGEPATAQVPGGTVAIFVRSLQARPGTDFSLMRRAQGEVLDGLRRTLGIVERGKQSGVIALSFSGKDPEYVTQVIDHIENAYLVQNVERRSADAQQSLEFLQKQLPDLKARVNEAQANLNVYQLARGTVDVTAETDLVLKQSVELETQRLQLATKRDEELQHYTSQHPVIVAIDQQIDSVKKAQEKLQSQQDRLPKTQQEILTLTRDLTVDSDLYTQMLNTIQQLQVAKAGTIGNARIIDYALQPDKPSAPRTLKTLASALMLGIVLGICCVFVQRALLRGVDDPKEVERQLGLTTYATIPFVPEQRKVWRAIQKREPGSHILALLDGTNLAIEALRSLRTSLHFALMESINNVVMLTGPAPGIGKSFLTINLAAVLVMSGKRVIVLDADLRRGRLHTYISAPPDPGISDYVVGDADASAIIRNTELKGLDLIARGTSPPNPSELLMHERLATLIRKLSADYDYVLIDTPPVMAVTDALIVGQLAGCTLLVLKSAQHPLREIGETVRRLTGSGVNVRGVLFNQVGARAGSYGHGSYGYTQYRYDK